MRERSAAELATDLDDLLHRKLGIRGQGLEERLARAGRRLPARIRARAAEIAEAEKAAANPRLARRHDPAALARAHAEVAAHLQALDPADRRIGALLGVLGSVSFSLIAVFALVVALLVWRGYL